MGGLQCLWTASQQQPDTAPFLNIYSSSHHTRDVRDMWQRCGGGVTCLFTDYRSLMHTFWVSDKRWWWYRVILILYFILFYRLVRNNIQNRCSVTINTVSPMASQDRPFLIVSRRPPFAALLSTGFYESAPLQWLFTESEWAERANSFPLKLSTRLSCASTTFYVCDKGWKINYTQWWVYESIII